MAVYQVETENGVYEVETAEQSAQPEKMVGSIFGKVPESAYQAGERNVLGNVFERPGAAIRSALQGKGYTAGAINPTNVPTFQDLAIQKSQVTTSPVANAAIGMIPSAVGLAADIVTNPADVLTSILPGVKPVQQAGRAIMSTKAGKALSEIATMPIEQIGRPTAEQLGQKVSKTVKQGIEKAVRPSVIGKRTATQQEAYFKKAESAVKDVLDNKPNLEIVDRNGNLSVGKNPESLNEALQAVGQTREGIFETYSPMIKKASDEGAMVDGNTIAGRLKAFASQENVQLSNPGLAKYADDVATRWEGKQIPLEVAEQTAKDFNAMLKQKYQQGKISGADVSSAHVDDMVVRMLRNEIADKAGVGDLKKRYGALAELEGDLAKRAIVAGRQNPVGLIESMANISSGSDIAGGVVLSLMTNNPAYMGFAVKGLATKFAGNLIKNANSPDANIAKMFKTVEKLRGIPTRTIPIKVAPAVIKTPVPSNESTVTGALKGKTPIVSRKKLGNKGQTIIPGGTKKPQDFKTAEEYVASKKAGILSTEDIELAPAKAKAQNIIGAAFIQDGKIYGKKYSEGAMNHSDIAEKFKLDYNKAKPGFIDKNGNFLYQFEEDIPKSQLIAEWQAAKKKIAAGAAVAGTAIGMDSDAKADTVNYKVGDKQETEASTYGWGEKLNEKTFDGSKFDPMDVTAAMRNIPMGSKVKVTDKKTGKSITVKINDGGPAHKTKRAIDLSQGAWRKLGYNKAGLTNVEIEVLSLGDGKRYIGHSKKSTPIKRKGE